jgi:acetylornithine/N-succinyldiaminopimelate aminotransferase
MNSEEIRSLWSRHLMSTYAPGLALVRGRGAMVWDADGRKYLDFLAGIAVNALGHAHPRMLRALRDQAKTLIHVSNLYYTESAPRLAALLNERALGGKCFFCNSGAEANEGLIKLARLWGSTHGGRWRILTMCNSFHGRTLATLTATGQTKVQSGFEPLPDGFDYGEFNNLDFTRSRVGPQTAAILVESVQGEGGVVPATPEFLRGLRALCDEQGILLLCDEVQTGLGRTGRWFGYQHAGIEPDAISIAKGLGGGFPIGAIVAGPKLADVFQPGNHGSTFGGTPLACAVARAVIETIEEEGLVERAATLGAIFREGLDALRAKYPFIAEVRGLGLMTGLVLDRPAKDLELALRERGLLAIATAQNVVRFLPPMIVTEAQIRRALRIVKAACQAIARAA